MPDEPAADRTTAPQSPYTRRQVRLGILIFLVGVFIAVAIPVIAL